MNEVTLEAQLFWEILEKSSEVTHREEAKADWAIGPSPPIPTSRAGGLLFTPFRPIRIISPPYPLQFSIRVLYA
jgi:hypothetical protein